MKYIKLFEFFESDNAKIIDAVNHIIKYSSYKGGGELYAGQNSNFQQHFTKEGDQNGPGKIIGISDIDEQFFIGQGDTLKCYNPQSYVNSEDFLGVFNRFMKTNYSKLAF